MLQSRKNMLQNIEKKTNLQTKTNPTPPPPPLLRPEKVKWSAVTHGLLIAQCTYSGLLQLVVWQILNERGGGGVRGMQCRDPYSSFKHKKGIGDAFFMFK